MHGMTPQHGTEHSPERHAPLHGTRSSLLFIARASPQVSCLLKKLYFINVATDTELAQ